MAEGSSGAVWFGAPGFEVLDVAADGDELVIEVPTTATTVGCSRCGTQARPKSSAEAVEERAQAQHLRVEATRRAERICRERALSEVDRAANIERLLHERRARLDPAGDRMIQLIDAYWFWRGQGTNALESAATELGLSMSEATRLMNVAGAETLQGRRPADVRRAPATSPRLAPAVHEMAGAGRCAIRSGRFGGVGSNDWAFS